MTIEVINNCQEIRVREVTLGFDTAPEDWVISLALGTSIDISDYTQQNIVPTITPVSDYHQLEWIIPITINDVYNVYLSAIDINGDFLNEGSITVDCVVPEGESDNFVSVVSVEEEISNFISVISIEPDNFVSVISVIEQPEIDTTVTTEYVGECEKTKIIWGSNRGIDNSCHRGTAIKLTNLRTNEEIELSGAHSEYAREWYFSIPKDAPVMVRIYEDSREIVQNPDGTCTFVGDEINLQLKVEQPILVLCRSILCRNKAEELDIRNLNCTDCNYKSNFEIIDAMIASAQASLFVNIKDVITKIEFIEKFCHSCGIKCCASC